MFIKLGLHCLHANHIIFVTYQDVNGLIIISFVDNLNIFAPHGSSIICRINKELTAAFKIVDMGPLVFYVGLKITQNREKWIIKLLQPDYIKKPLDCHGIYKAKTAKVLMQDTILLPSVTLISELDKAKYSAKFGSMIYTMFETRIDIVFAISMVSNFVKNSSLEHFHAIDQILRYLAGSQDKGIIFGREKELKLVRYLDSD